MTNQRAPARPMRAPWLGRFARMLITQVSLHIGIATAVGVTLFLVVDFVEVTNLASDSATSADLARLSVLNIPRVLKVLFPVSVSIGALTAAGTLARRLEIAGLFAAGGAPAALLKPALIVSLIWAGVQAGVVEWLVPGASSRASEVRRRIGLPSRSGSMLGGRHTWLKGKDVLYRVRAMADPEGTRLEDVLILRVDGARLADRWDVDRLEYAAGRWTARGVVHRRLAAEAAGPRLSTRTHEVQDLGVAEVPRDFLRGIGIPERLSYAALADSTRVRERLGRPAVEHRLELYHRHCGPLSIALAIVLAVAVAVRLGPRQTLGAAMAAGAGLGFGAWLLLEVGRMAGGAGAVPPWAAIHAVPLVLLGAGAVAWTRVARRGLSRA